MSWKTQLGAQSCQTLFLDVGTNTGHMAYVTLSASEGDFNPLLRRGTLSSFILPHTHIVHFTFITSEFVMNVEFSSRLP